MKRSQNVVNIGVVYYCSFSGRGEPIFPWVHFPNGVGSLSWVHLDLFVGSFEPIFVGSFEPTLSTIIFRYNLLSHYPDNPELTELFKARDTSKKRSVCESASLTNSDFQVIYCCLETAYLLFFPVLFFPASHHTRFLYHQYPLPDR